MGNWGGYSLRGGGGFDGGVEGGPAGGHDRGRWEVCAPTADAACVAPF